eukprot:CAMPEP_0114611680 /NCGR_PEP_ID=MMETSP0168-20121206/4241_1 /TAXON_ID=95228 ORGANISM="Vannella sp., Strain DIVA3 517/6/12" /NCGR_SAMPLE_ID=MMETSP0168 /ASSEMBLY_ACC=CAM_ASM_000044 /LENGTH=619 /DNA_ID=CAMNT_0001822661 /DNA_START=344 /DNA_END=2200 /DNA_ORIENTATION=-
MTSFRPRPIDVDKPMPVLRKNIEDDLTSRPLVAVVATGMESHEENESHIKQAIEEAARKKTRIQANIPTPTCRIVEYYEEMHPDDFNPGEEFIVYQPEVNIFEEVDVGSVEYDLDLEDVAFIERINEQTGATAAEAEKAAKRKTSGGSKGAATATVSGAGVERNGERATSDGSGRVTTMRAAIATEEVPHVPAGFVLGPDGSLVKKKRPVGRPRKHPLPPKVPTLLVEGDFEFVMDRLEREQAKNIILPPPAAHLGADGFITLQYFSRVIADSRRCPLPANLVTAIYLHWAEKRVKAGGPLLDRYKPKPKGDDPSPWVAFRPRDKDPKYKKPRRSNNQVMSRVRHLKREMATAQMLLELVVKREKDKKELLRVSKRHFELDFLHSERQLKFGTYDKPSRKHEQDDDELSSSRESDTSRPSAAAAEEELLEVGDLTLDSERQFDRYPPHVHHTFADPPGQRHWGTVRLPGMRPFRGRARVGRGGRVVFDRWFDPSVAPRYFSSSSSDERELSDNDDDDDDELARFECDSAFALDQSFLSSLAALGVGVSRAPPPPPQPMDTDSTPAHVGADGAEPEAEVDCDGDVVVDAFGGADRPTAPVPPSALFYHSSYDGNFAGTPI